MFAEVDLKARLDKLSPRPVSIRYAATENGFALSVRDRFGRLDKTTMLRYIDKCLHSPQQIDRKIYGAGLGIYLIANAATQFVVNVAPGMATEVVCTFDRKTRTRLACARSPCSSTRAPRSSSNSSSRGPVSADGVVARRRADARQLPAPVAARRRRHGRDLPRARRTASAASRSTSRSR